MLVIWSPRGARVPMAWGGYVGAAGYLMGCQIDRLSSHTDYLPIITPWAGYGVKTPVNLITRQFLQLKPV